MKRLFVFTIIALVALVSWVAFGVEVDDSQSFIDGNSISYIDTLANSVTSYYPSSTGMQLFFAPAGEYRRTGYTFFNNVVIKVQPITNSDTDNVWVEMKNYDGRWMRYYSNTSVGADSTVVTTITLTNVHGAEYVRVATDADSTDILGVFMSAGN